MSTAGQLNSYMGRLESRLRLGALLRGAAILTSVALAATLVLVLATNALAFSHISITGARILLFIALAFALGFGLAIPLYGLDRRRVAGKAETVFPEFQQRLVTFAEREKGPRDPFLELLAADALQVAGATEPKRIFPDTKLMLSLAVGAASLGVLVWMIVAGPGYLGHGAALLWIGAPSNSTPFYDIHVTPGDAAVRRNGNQVVTAQLTGVQADKVLLYARYNSTSKWEQVVMQPQPGGSAFQFLFNGLPEGVEYYVEAGPLRSSHYNLRVVDLPAVKQIRVTYRYPAWTGLKEVVEDHGGDLRAVEGTNADLEILMDRPMRDGLLVVNDAQQLGLSGGDGNLYRGTVRIDNDGQYHVAALDQGQQVRLSEDFFIEAHKVGAPTVRVSKPGPDYHASPIEEVAVSVSADAEFGIHDMALHYSVNGGPEQTVNLLKQKGAKQADAATTLSLEDFKMVPGDVVSLYATAKDARTDARTDMMFIQADPFEKEYSQSQAAGGGAGGGGGGGGGGNQNEISQREKEIIAQTWKQQGDKSAAKQQAAETAKFLNNVQSKLRDQALSLAGRLERRELSAANQEFSDFQNDMNSAAQAMNGAADKLKDEKWNEALPAEQKALQNLLRAEATFRQIQVAFGSRAGGGGGGGGGAARDLESLFDLELDTEKNQYETGQTADPATKRAQEIDDALQKLDQLARRQQELAEQPQPNSPEQTQQQRYQQEMLRRQADELQRQMEQMTQNQRPSQPGSQNQSGGQQQQGNQAGSQPGGQSSGGQSSGQSGSQSSASGGQPGGQSGAGGSQSQGGTGADPRVQQALDRLRQANDDMRRATSAPQNQADARRAADRLREATNLLGSTGQQQASQQMDSIARDANRLGNDERSQADRQKQMQGQNGRSAGSGQPSASAQAQEQSKLADERQRTADELASLEKQMQDAVRAMASSQHDAASKLRDALGGLDQSDLENRLQRSAQGMRRGSDPNAEENEKNIAAGMQRLEDQLRDAQQAVTNQKGSDTEQALDQVERLRNQMEALSRNLGAQNSRGGQQQGGQQGGQQGQQGGQRAGQPGQGQGQGQGQGAGNQNGNGSGAGNMANNGNNVGGPGARTGQYGGGAGPQYGGPLGFDTGGYTNSGTERQPVPVTQADLERAYQDAQRQLEQLRQQVQGQPGPLSDIQDLLRQIQQMDPSRFPGNPAMIEELHNQVLTTVDKLELQLRRQLDDKQQGQVRSGDSLPVPAGYQDSVADYFRRLSKNSPNNP